MRRTSKILDLGWLFFLLAIPSARALIGLPYQMQLGNPSGATTDTNNHAHYLIQRTVEALDYSDNFGEPNWVSWDLTAGDVGSSGRSSSFFTDSSLPGNFFAVAPEDYTNSGYDRGHMCPSGDRTDNTTDNDLVFRMSNIIPQSPLNDHTVWNNFETYCRTLAQGGSELLIICGPSGFNGARIPSGRAAIAGYTWKIVVVVPAGAGMAASRITEANRVIAIKVPNNEGVSSAWQNYVTSPQQIETDTGLTFFTALTPPVAAALRVKVDGQTSLPPGIDLTVGSSHAGDFTLGQTNAVYTVTVNNLGGTASSGTVTVTNILPAGLTATSISGTGWTGDLASGTASRSDAVAGGGNFPPLYVTATVASNAPSLGTNAVFISGGGDPNPANNSDFDPTAIHPYVAPIPGARVVLAGFDVSGQNGFGASPMLATTNDPGVTVLGLSRGPGVTLTGTPAGRAWGGTGFADTSAAGAIAAGHFCTFSVTPVAGQQVSFSSISRFDYRHSGTGPTNGLLQFQVGSGSFLDVTNINYNVAASSGASVGAIDLSGIFALQNVTNTVTFRIVNWNGAAGGTWYIYDVGATAAADLSVDGIVSQVPPPPPTPIESWRLTWFGTSANAGDAADGKILAADGMPNLLKYALGLSPLGVAPSPLLASVSNRFLRVSVSRNPIATDVQFFLEGTPSLNPLSWGTENTVIDVDIPDRLEGHLTSVIDANLSGFLRLRVTRP